MSKIPSYSGCFVCGDKNEIGIKATFTFDGKSAITEVIASRLFEGYHGLYHGGILSTLLDEVMIKAILAQEIVSVTAEMTVRFIRPVHTDDHLRFRGWITRDRGRMIFTEGEVTDLDGQLLATAKGKYIQVKGDFKANLQRSLSES